MSLKSKSLIAIIATIIVLIFSIGVGTVYITPIEIAQIIKSKIFGTTISIKPIHIGIIWNMRLPRVLIAFLVGSLLSVSGAVMQSILKNPLASSYTLGISSGAAFGIGLFLFFGVPVNMFGIFTLPVIGFLAGISTVIFAITVASKLDVNMSNNSIVLIGIIFSLFINGLITLISALSNETLEKMVHWQMGSFALKDWSFIFVLLPVNIIGILVLTQYANELDNLTFGEEAAFVVGVDVKKVKWILLCASAALTGCAVSIAGVIGFIDLITPHVIRKIFGSRHKIVIPLSAIIGGAFMVVADVFARTFVKHMELPVGAVTAIIGAPFFFYVYFSKKAVN